MDQPSRRAVLRAAVVVAVSATAPALLVQPAAATTRPGPTRLRRRVFTPHAGTAFALSDGRTAHRAVLVAVSAVGKASETRFSLLFRMTGAARPEAGTFTVTHPKLRAFELYAGGIGERSDGWYEAVVYA